VFVMCQWQRFVCMHPIPLDDASRRAHNRAISRHISIDDNRGRPYFRVVANIDGAEKCRIGTDHYIVTHGWMPLVHVMSSSAERHTMEKDAIISDLRSFSDDNPRSVIDKKSFTNLCSGMYLDTTPEANQHRDKSRQDRNLQLYVEKMRDSVSQNRMECCVAQNDFNDVSSRGIVFPDGLYVFNDFD
jgi:hypothetical protein